MTDYMPNKLKPNGMVQQTNKITILIYFKHRKCFATNMQSKRSYRS